MYESQIQTSTQSAPVSMGKALEPIHNFYVIVQEEKFFLD